MLPIIQFWVILQHMYKMSQKLQKLAFFNEHVQKKTDTNQCLTDTLN